MIPGAGYFVTNNDRVVRLSNGRLVIPASYHRMQGESITDWKTISGRFSGSYFFMSDDDGKNDLSHETTVIYTLSRQKVVSRSQKSSSFYHKGGNCVSSYKVLIVEDEEAIRSHIKKLIDWDSINFEIVGEAENGNQAVELIEKLSPHIVLLDIRLPSQDGLEVLKKTANKAIFFIAITAYKDFNYAYNCLNYKVSSYLLKPISKDELFAAVIKIKDNLDNITANRINNDIIKNQVDLSNKIIKSRVFEEIIFGYEVDNDNSKQKIKEYDISFKEYVSVAVIEPIKSSTDDIQLSKSLVQSVNLSSVDEVQIVNIIFPVDSCSIIIIMTSDLCISENKLSHSFNKLKQHINQKYEVYGLEFVVGISNWHNNWISIRNAWKEACIALSCKYFDGNEGVFFFKNSFKIDDITLRNSNKSSFMENNIKDDIFKCIDNYELDKAKQKYDEYFTLCVKLNTRTEYNYKFIDLITRLQAFVASKSSMEDNSNNEYRINTIEISKSIFSKVTVNELKNYIYNIIDSLFENLTKMHYHTIPAIKQVISYIDENYKSDISLNEVASLVYMSPTYFSSFFKQKTGITFSNFLTKYRIDKAKFLLNKNIYNPIEISQMVGYSSNRYFRKIFKEFTGVSPNEYLKY